MLMRHGFVILACVSFLLTTPLAAQSSSGSFDFALAGSKGTVTYEAAGEGTFASGRMTFTGSFDPTEKGDEDTGPTIDYLEMTVSLDCHRVDKNVAATTGVVSSSNDPDYLGARVLLAVEDNGDDDKERPDRFTWGVYKQTKDPEWIPSDAEVKDDRGAFMSWWATDAEREDDKGIDSKRSKLVDCQSFSFENYEFEDIAAGTGGIVVKP
jgi:hypothetical protein